MDKDNFVRHMMIVVGRLNHASQEASQIVFALLDAQPAGIDYEEIESTLRSAHHHLAEAKGLLNEFVPTPQINDNPFKD